MKQNFYVFAIYLAILWVASAAYAQDIIVTNDAQKIEAKIIEATGTAIKYKEPDNLDGPTFVLNIEDLSSIIYSNGKVVLYDQKVNNPEGETRITSTPNADTITKPASITIEDSTQKETSLVGEDNNETLSSEHTYIVSTHFLTDEEITQKNLAVVHKYAGLFIFNDSEPICDYTVLGRVKAGVSLSSQYEGVRNHLVNKTLKKYPLADAVILNLTDGGIDLATAIKFNDLNKKNKWCYAKVNSYNGLYIFSECEPANGYTIIGRCKSAVTWSGQYDAVKANLTKHALKQNIAGQGIILDMHQGGVDRGVIIIF